MKKALILLVFIFVFGLFMNIKVMAETNYDGQLVRTQTQSTLYYVMEGKRYVFPNEKIYNSWFSDFSDVVTITESEMASLPLEGNIKYRPGVILVKIQSDPKVYVVSQNGQLRWLKNEALAKKFYGDNWAKLIDDVPDSFFMDYKIVSAIEDQDDYNVEDEINNNSTIEKNHGLHLGQLKQKLSTTTKCRAIPATPAVPAKKSPTGKHIPAVPATPASRICHIEHPDEDTEAPVISSISVSVLYNSATINWNTNELANGAVIYSKDNFVNSTTTSSSVSTTTHSIVLNNLTASTTYQYYVKSVDPAGNIATSTKASFVTSNEPDTQAPIITNLSVGLISSTTGTITWTTNELADSKVIFSTDNYATSVTVSFADLVTSHSVVLNSLTASTTYSYYVVSKDSSNNTATSSSYSFITLQE